MMRKIKREIREYVYSRAGYRCELRKEGCYYNKKLEIHHIIPNTKINRKLYGDEINSPKNLIVLCYNCHRQYKDTIPQEFRKEAPRYFEWLHYF